MGNETSYETTILPHREELSNYRKHFSSIYVANYKFEPPCNPKTHQAIQFIKESLADSFLYQCLDEDEKKLFINAMEHYTIEKNAIIIKQGDFGDYFYLIKEGRVEFFIDGIQANECSRGGSFGELSLLFGFRRKATCKAKTPLTVWRIDKHTFRGIMTCKAISKKRKLIKIFKNVSIFTKLSDTILDKIADAMEINSYTGGTRIIQKGEIGKDFFIVKHGTVKIHDIGVGGSKFVDRTIEKGEYFGEMALLSGLPRAANVTAVTDCSLLRLDKEKFHKTVGIYDDIMKSAVRKQILMSAPVFANSDLKDSEINDLFSLFKEKNFAAGTFFVKAGDVIPDRGFHIIEEGRVRVLEKNGVIADLVKGNHFGGQTIHFTENQRSERTIEFLAPTRLATLSRSSIESVILSISRLGKPQSFERALSQVTIDELNQHRIIGLGKLGTVRLASHRVTLKPYALKIIPKRKIISQKKCESLIREKNMLSCMAQSPFIIQLFGTFQDNNNIYFLCNFVQGGELSKIIHSKEKTGISIPEALFYTACIVLCLSHLNRYRICYRDINTSNVLIDEKGYCVLADFDEAKITTDKTFTFCGTREYLAPEMILYKGHDQGVDYWAIGIFLYELLASKTPFYKHDIDNVALFKRIVKVKYKFPNDERFTDNVQDFIGKLLVKDTSHRLGCLADGMRGIREHPIFKTISWKNLLFRKIEAPWIPKIKGDLDPSNFDVYPELPVQSENETFTVEEEALFKNF